MTARADCYSGAERRWMELGQRLRARLLAPLLAASERAGLGADQVTLASLLAGLAASLFLAGAPAPGLALLGLALLALHVILDGFDGPLARRLGTASDRGSFTDTAADQVVVTATTLALAHAGLIGAPVAVLYTTAYLAVVGLAIVRNALEVPYAWLVRPRFLVYAWVPVELWLWSGTLEPLMAVAGLVLGAKAASGVLAVRRRL